MRVITFVLHSAFLVLLCCRFSIQISCKDENNNDVDWFVNYKLPQIEAEPEGSNLGEGKAYAYITAPGSSWKLSSKSVDEGSMLEKTMDEFYSNKKELAYLFYNDEVPEGFKGTSVGHCKGVVAFDTTSGFWLIHSIPKFADDEEYSYPDNALEYGQSILCVTFKTDELNEISNQLLYGGPNIYSYSITEEISDTLDDEAKTLFSDKPSFIKTCPLTRTATLKSLDGESFMSFAKDNQKKIDLYSDIIAPGLESPLIVETWRKGIGTVLKPVCRSERNVADVQSINMTIKHGRNSKSIVFEYTEDHSKWAIADDGDEKWICIADLNRMKSQSKRGGGALCFVSTEVWNAFNSIIDEVKYCPAERSKEKR